LQRNGEVDDGRRKKRGGARGQAAAERLGLPWPHGLVGEDPAEVAEGSWRCGAHRRRGISAAEDLPAAELRVKFGPRNGPRSRVKGSGAPG
jgi:hypothetical protein